MSRVALAILIAIIAACGPPREVPLRLQESTDELGRRVAVELKSWKDDMFGGEGAVGLRVTVHNVSNQPLVNCSLSLDDRFQSALDRLEVYRGFFAGNRPWGHTSLVAGEKVAFEFHHDNSNYGIVRANDGRMPSGTTVPHSIDIVCGDFRARWTTGGPAS